MTNCWSFATAAKKHTKRLLSHTCGDSLTLTSSSKTVHQHTPLARWLSFWITRCMTLCPHVAWCWYDEHFSRVNQIKVHYWNSTSWDRHACTHDTLRRHRYITTRKKYL